MVVTFRRPVLVAAVCLVCLQFDAAASAQTATYSANSPVGQLIDNPATLAILRRDVPQVVDNPLYLGSRGYSLRVVQKLSKGAIPPEAVDAAEADLKAIPIAPDNLPLNGAGDNFMGIRTFPLWAGPAPDSTSPNDQPSLTVMPAEGPPTGTAVIIPPGGAYMGLSAALEGREVADWFAAHGVTAFVLKYRVGAKNPMPAPLIDAERAVRLVRSRAKAFGLAPDRIGLTGFSAGGHLAALEATLGEPGVADATDPIDRVDARPDFLILGYPALNMFSPMEKTIPYCRLMAIKPACDATWYDRYRPENHVSAHTPPTFIYHTTTDELVPVAGSVNFYSLLTQAGVPVEMHLFASGKHGSGLGKGDAALGQWPMLLEAWLRGRGLLSPAGSSLR